MVEQAVEQLIRAATLNSRGGIRIMANEAVKNVMYDQIRTPVLLVTINKQIGRYFEAAKAAKALGKRFVRNYELSPPLA